MSFIIIIELNPASEVDSRQVELVHDFVDKNGTNLLRVLRIISIWMNLSLSLLLTAVRYIGTCKLKWEVDMVITETNQPSSLRKNLSEVHRDNEVNTP